MDPYIRLRVGNAVFETHTCVSGGKAPTWNRVINAYLPVGVESIYVQIFDEVSGIILVQILVIYHSFIEFHYYFSVLSPKMNVLPGPTLFSLMESTEERL